MHKRGSKEKVNETEVLEIVRENGGHRWVEIKTRQINDQRGAMEIHGIGRDITRNINRNNGLYILSESTGSDLNEFDGI